MALVNNHTQKLLSQLENTAITFDDITFRDLPSDIHPNDTILKTRFTTNYKSKMCGLISSAMDTVTEKEMAYAMAKMGGLGVIHRNLSIEEQCKHVAWVRNKVHHGDLIENPVVYKGTNTISDIECDIKSNGWSFTNFPIINDTGELLGMVSRNELEFVETDNPLLKEIMIPREKLVTTNSINRDIAYNIMIDKKVKKLPIIDSNNKFIGMYAWNDVRKHGNKEHFSLDNDGRFLVAAAVGANENEKERVKKLAEVDCKIIVIDTSHGSSSYVIDMLFWIKDNFPGIDVIVGNIASYESAKFILEKCIHHNESKGKDYLPNAIKTGISSGSICTTRRVTGHGIPQLTAIHQVWTCLNDLKKTNIPIIADGGIRYSGDLLKAFAVGASAVMMGNIFAGTDESPGKIITSDGNKYKVIRGMGSRSAMEDRDGSRMRYFANNKNTGKLTNNQKKKITPEGVEATIRYKGPVENVFNEFIGGVQSGMAHSGAKTFKDFRNKCKAWIQNNAGINEGNPHSLHKIID